jgi:protein O-GlcNAc transferase
VVASRYPAFLPTVVDPQPAEAAVLKEIEAGLDEHEAGRYWQAEKVYRRVVEKHGSPRARALLALLQEQKASNPRHLASMAAACAADPNDMLIAGNWGGALQTLGRVEDAIEAYSRAVEAAPQYALAYVGLGSCLADVLRHTEAVYAYRQGVEADPAAFAYWSDLVFTTDLSDGHAFRDSMAVRREINDRFMAPLMADPIRHTNDPDPERKLRIGYASADMYQHSGAMTWGGFLVNHDKRQVHVTLYSATLKHDQMTAHFKKAADQWYDVQDWSDDKLAVQVVKDKIDILIDLAGYSKGGRLPAFARRPAPIQVSGWGYATGTGLDALDYFATDATVVPVEEEGQYHERPWRLPSALSWVAPRDALPVGHVRAALGRPVCFGVFNRQPKITRSSVRAWASILKRVPGSWLMVKNGRLDHPQIKAGIERAFEAEGITEPRVMLAGMGNHWDHLAAHWIPDIMLDPFPQGGGVSAFESLWMGVPIVTLSGDRPGGRIAASLLRQVELGDWVAEDEEGYIQRAVEAARDLERLTQIRATLRERVNAMPATQLKPYARAVEAGYRERWRAWCGKQRQEGV